MGIYWIYFPSWWFNGNMMVLLGRYWGCTRLGYIHRYWDIFMGLHIMFKGLNPILRKRMNQNIVNICKRMFFMDPSLNLYSIGKLKHPYPFLQLAIRAIRDGSKPMSLPQQLRGCKKRLVCLSHDSSIPFFHPMEIQRLVSLCSWLSWKILMSIN